MKNLFLGKNSTIPGRVKDNIILVFLAFIATFQVGYLLSTASIFGAAWGLALTGFFAGDTALLFYTRKFILSHDDGSFKRRTIWAVVLGIILGLTYVFGYQLQYIGNSAPGFMGKASIVLRSICLLPIFYPAFYLLLYAVDHVKEIEITGECAYPKKKIYLLSWLCIFISWIPAFLAYYPMIMSYDFHAQVLYSALGFDAISSHHPYLSTLEIDLFYHIGLWINNTQLGMAFMALFHMIINSAAYACAVVVLSKLIPKKPTPFIAACAFGLFPTNPVMILSTTKDVIFSLFFLLFICTIFERFLFSFTKKRKIVFDILIAVTGIMSCLWRNNMVYAVAVAGVLLVIFVKKQYKLLILILTVVIFLGNKLGIMGLRTLVHDENDTNKMEMLSVVVQAYGRTVTKNMDSLDPEVSRIIEYYIPREGWEYHPGISDAMKNAPLVYDTYGHFVDNWGDTFKDFFFVIRRYPNEFLDSFLDTTRGYWFLDDTSFADVLGEGYEGRMGIIYTYNASESWVVDEIKHESKLPFVEYLYESVVSEDVLLRAPVINLLFKISFYTISTVLAALLFIYKKNKKGLALITFSIMYILTMFLGPVVQFRYAYPWILTLPFFVTLFFVKPGE
ncbi:MAG: hypothetical protein J6S95_07600 [Lachnospiraceae bacterium]|nr:hypothetical protein [Lachnospiraceae bacterium]